MMQFVLSKYVRGLILCTIVSTGTPTFAALTNPKVSNDQQNIYFSYNEDKTFPYNQVYIDNDLNAKTGYYIGGIGADRLIENRSIYKHPPGTGWNWTKMQNVIYSNTNGVYKWTIPLNTLGVLLQCNTPIKVVMRAGSANSGDVSQAIDYKLILGENCGDQDSGAIINPTATSTTTQYTFSYKSTTAQQTYRVFIDTNKDPNTGYPIGGLGAKFLLEGEDLLAYVGPGYTWQPIKKVTYTRTTDNIVKWTINRSDINVNGALDCANSMNYLYQIENTGTVNSGAKSTLNYPSNSSCNDPTPPPPGPLPVGITWNYVLSSNVDLSIKAGVYDIDGFTTSAATVASIHAAGSKAICYISAGSWEDWRPDASKFPASVKGNSNGWPGERWLDIRQIAILGPIMQARLDMCRSKGFDAVEFDNVDGYTNNTGFPLTGQHQIAYNTYLANEAHKRGLLAALKNDVDQVNALQSVFDFAINEQCFQYNECGVLSAFINANKPVLNVEYQGSTSVFCPKANAMKFSSIKKDLNLNNPVTFC